MYFISSLTEWIQQKCIVLTNYTIYKQCHRSHFEILHACTIFIKQTMVAHTQKALFLHPYTYICVYLFFWSNRYMMLLFLTFCFSQLMRSIMSQQYRITAIILCNIMGQYSGVLSMNGMNGRNNDVLMQLNLTKDTTGLLEIL